MRGRILRLGLLIALLSIAFYALRGDTSIPQKFLDTLSLLKKPIEDLLPDLDTVGAEEANEQAPLDLDAYQELHNQRERWNEMRALIEAGRPLFTPLPSEVAISTIPAGRLAPAVPPPPGFTVQLPYESRLTVSGRKVIGFNYQSTSYSNTVYANQQGVVPTQSNFQLQQQLQVRINGQIGRKVTVNVDFDDTKADKKDISIVYKGDPDEIVQRAAFGDINLSLPQSEFAGYNKQVFGAEAELRYKALHNYVIGSRTKGQTETKEFTGNVIIQRLAIADNSYVRRRFYNIAKLSGGSGDAPFSPTSGASLKVWLDNRDTTRPSNIFDPNVKTVDSSLLSASNPGVSDYTVSGANDGFVLLAPGSDYTFDPVFGVITFKNPLLSNAVVAIDYLLPNSTLLSNNRGQSGLKKMIKFDETILTQIPGTEDLTHYIFGAAPIVRDNAQGNFTLQLQDLNAGNVGSQLGINYLPNNAGQIFVDFEAGTFFLKVRLDSSTASFSDIYATNPNHRFNFFAEFQSQVKTYTLRPNIVINSERITLDGKLLARDIDYFIDYQSGFITFFNPTQITQTSHIVATYDFSPFGIAGAQTDTLVGERTELSFYPISPLLTQSYVGSTVLYDFAPKVVATPDIRQTAGSFLLTEADVLFKELVIDPLPLLKSTFGAEVARSAHNPNSAGKALIDNMEGIKDETTVGLNLLTWTIAANPTTSSAYASALYSGMANEILPTQTVNPNASALPGDQQQVLDLNYDLTKSSEASVVTVLSPTGLDFSRKLFVEMFIYGDGTKAAGTPSGTLMNMTLGQISEDADGTHGGGFTDINGTHPLRDGTPRTEDLNHNNTLDVGEDTGWTYFNPDGTSTQIGANNNHLDTEDLDLNGVLNPADPSVGGDVGYQSSVSSISAAGASTVNAVDFSGWKFVRIPLNISSATASSWSAIKELRISLKAGSGGGTKGQIKIGKISIVGNKWQAQQPVSSGASISAFAISNETDPSFVSAAGNPDFDALNQIDTSLSGPAPSKIRDQALAIDYTLPSGMQGSSVTAISVTGTPMDFTAYGGIRFFLHGDNHGENFFFRVGSDTDFLLFSVPVNFTGWQELFIKQVSSTGDQHPNTWQADSRNPPGCTVTVHGNPNLSSVAQMEAGIINPNSATVSGEVWFDEINAADVITSIGYAARVNSDFDVTGWAKFGMVVRDIDRNFQTFTSALNNQDRHEEKAYFNFVHLPYFPMAFEGRKTRTVTPNILQINNTSLVSVLQEGRVDDQFYSGTGTLQVPAWPKIGMLYDTDRTDTSQLFRTDHTDHFGGTFDYTVPAARAWMPKTISLGFKRTNLAIDFTPDALLNAADPSTVSNTHDSTNDYSIKLGFQPFSGFTFNPRVSRSTTREMKDLIVDSHTLATASLDYSKSRSQTMGFDGTMAFRRWLSPRLRYTVTNTETFGIPLSTNLTAQNEKSVDRQDTGELAWDFAYRDFSKRYTALQSLNISTSYLIEDGDSWQNVGSGYNTLNILSVRQSLNPGNSDASRQQLTERDTLRSVQRWSPFDWAIWWSGAALPLRTLSLTSTLTNANQRQETTGTPSHILTHIYPDLIFSLTQTEQFFHADKFMSNSQMNIKTQYKTVETENTSHERATTNGGDWRFTLWKKLDLFFTYTRTTDTLFDEIQNVVASDGHTEMLGAQLSFNLGRWRYTPKYDQNKQFAVNSAGQPTTDLTTRTAALQIYADLFLPEGLKLPFSDLIVFSNRIRTTNTLSLSQQRSDLNALQSNTDTYTMTTSEDYEMTSNIRLTVGGSYSYVNNKTTVNANTYTYTFNSLLTIQF